MSDTFLTLEIYQGTRPGPVVFVLKDGAGDAYDLEDCVITGQIRRKRSASGELLKQMTLEINDSAGGEVTWDPTEADTASLPVGKWPFDLILTDADDRRHPPVLIGEIVVKETATQEVA